MGASLLDEAAERTVQAGPQQRCSCEGRAVCRPLNLAEAVPAEAALLASTIRAAELGGLQDRLGSIRCAIPA